MAIDIWSYRETVVEADLSDYKVAAVDGEIGKIDRATYEAGSDSLIVDTGPLVFGRKVFLPIGTIDRIDAASKTVYVDRTKDEIKHAPEYDPSGYAEQEYRLALEDYYRRFYE